jgi:hypothetical protein
MPKSTINAYINPRNKDEQPLIVRHVAKLKPTLTEHRTKSLVICLRWISSTWIRPTSFAQGSRTKWIESTLMRSDSTCAKMVKPIFLSTARSHLFGSPNTSPTSAKSCSYVCASSSTMGSSCQEAVRWKDRHLANRKVHSRSAQQC